MADVITGLTETSATAEQIVAAEVQEVLTAAMVVPPTISDYSSMVGPGMDRVKIPRFGNFTVATKAENVAVDAQSIAFSVDSLLLDQHKVVQVLVEDISDLQAKVNVTQVYVQQMAKDLAAQMDQKLIDDIESGTSAAAPDHRIAYAGASLAKADILSARQLLNTQKVPLADRTLLVSPVSEAALMAISEFTRVDEAGGSEALRNGQIGKLFGFAVIMSSQVEDLKTLAYHKSCHAFARQLAPRVQQFNDIANLAQRWSVDHIYGSKSLDSGKRQVLLGSAT